MGEEEFTPRQRFNKRIYRERRTNSFNLLTQSYVDSGIPKKDAWKYAAQSFMPLDGSEPEIDPIPGWNPEIDANPPPPEPVAPPAVVSPIDESLDHKPTKRKLTKAEQANKNEADRIAKIEKAKLETEAKRTLLNAVAQKTKEKEAKWEELRQSVARNVVFKRADIDAWLYENAGTPPEEINPKEVPGRGALRHLRQIQTNDVAYNDFLTDFVAKTIPSRSKMEVESKFNDDERTLDMLKKFQEDTAAKLAAQSAED